MRIVTNRGKFAADRKQFAEKYFAFASTIRDYSESNMGIVSVLSDLQSLIQLGYPIDREYWGTVLNNIKSVLIEDDIKKEGEEKCSS